VTGERQEEYQVKVSRLSMQGNHAEDAIAILQE
jgi:hypothetical protein